MLFYQSVKGRDPTHNKNIFFYVKKKTRNNKENIQFSKNPPFCPQSHSLVVVLLQQISYIFSNISSQTYICQLYLLVLEVLPSFHVSKG